MGQRKTDAQLLNELLAEQKAGTYVDPVASAKQFLAQPTVPDEISRQQGGQAAAQEQARTAGEANLLSGIKNRFKEDPLSAAGNVALPAAFLGGPLGMVAGGVMSVEALRNMAEEPTAGNALGVGLSALPFVGPAARTMGRGAMAAERLAPEANEALAMMRARLGRASTEVPFRMEAPAGQAYKPSAFRQAMQDFGPAAESVEVAAPESVAQMSPTMGEVDQLTSGLVQHPPMPGKIPMVNAAKLSPADLAELNAFMGQGLSEAEKAGLRQQIAQPGQIPQSFRGVESALGEAPTPKMHAPDTAGAEFGFDELPELSDAELTRMQDGWARTGYDRYESPGLPKSPQESVDAIRRLMGR